MGAPEEIPQPPRSLPRKPADHNRSDSRYHVYRKSIYERHLPGGAYITAHAERLQHGHFSSPAVTESDIDHVDFLAVTFVFHPADSHARRFRAANIRISIRNDLDGFASKGGVVFPDENPRFLMYAPHLIYGAVSPENLEWTFNLSGTLGISHAPVMASVTPGATLKEQYQIFGMMRIQGSLRTLKSPFGPAHDVEDGEIVWSLEENDLQKSGLPREFTFVTLIQKPHWDSRLSFFIEVDPMMNSWFGAYPSWWLTQTKYLPLPKRPVNFRQEIGQRFGPIQSRRGFNFATLASSFDDYINMPGSTSSSNMPAGAASSHNQDGAPADYSSPAQKSSTNNNSATSLSPPEAQSSKSEGRGEQTLNLNVFLDRSLSTRVAPSRRDDSPRQSPNSTARRRSLRRSRSREGLRVESQKPTNPFRTVLSADEKRYSYPSL